MWSDRKERERDLILNDSAQRRLPILRSIEDGGRQFRTQIHKRVQRKRRLLIDAGRRDSGEEFPSVRCDDATLKGHDDSISRLVPLHRRIERNDGLSANGRFGFDVDFSVRF